MKKIIVALTLVAGIGIASSSHAEQLYFNDRPRTGTLAFNGAIGFTLDPDTFLIAPSFDYFLLQNLSVGPLLQMGVSDSTFLLATSANFKGVFDIPIQDFPRRIKPFVQGGVGFCYTNYDGPPAADTDTVDFLFNLGFGVDVYLTTHFALGNNLMFNILPTSDNNNLFFSWQFVSARYHF